MAFINVSSIALKKTVDVLEERVKAFNATHAGRQLSNAEQRALKTIEDELEATRELYDAAARAEDGEQRGRGPSGPAAYASQEEADQAAVERQKILDNVINGNHPVLRSFPGPGASPTPSPALPAASGDPARRVIDQIHKRGLLPDKAAAVAERLVTTGDDESRSLASRWAVATGADKYLSAFTKLMGDPQRGHMLWTEEERHAYQQAEAVKRELRGMSTASGYGGALLPLFLDPAVLLTDSGSTNPLRQVARVVQTTSNTWQGVTSAGVTAEWKGEAVEAADATPDTDPAIVPVFMGSAYVPYSFELEQDGLDFANSLALLLIDAADQLQATAFATGNGTTQPQGFVTGLAGTDSEVPGLAETFGDVDVYGLQNSLGARFQPRASWLAALPTINTMAQFESTNGTRLFPEISTGQLLRRPLNECSAMASIDDVDADETAANLILAYGDWMAGYVIADRIGTMIEIVQHVVGANRRPTGERGAYMYFRSGAGVVNVNALRVLNLATVS